MRSFKIVFSGSSPLNTRLTLSQLQISINHQPAAKTLPSPHCLQSATKTDLLKAFTGCLIVLSNLLSCSPHQHLVLNYSLARRTAVKIITTAPGLLADFL